MSLLRWKIGRNVTTLVVGHEEDDDDDGVFSRSLSFSARVFFFCVPPVRSFISVMDSVDGKQLTRQCRHDLLCHRFSFLRSLVLVRPIPFNG